MIDLSVLGMDAHHHLHGKYRTTVAIYAGIRIMRLPALLAIPILVVIALSVLSLLSLHRPAAAALVAVLVIDLDLLVFFDRHFGRLRADSRNVRCWESPRCDDYIL